MDLLWTHSLYCKHSMELLSTPQQQTTQGYLPECFMTSCPTSSETRNLDSSSQHKVLYCAWAWGYIPSVYLRLWWEQRSSYGTLVRNSRESTFSTRMKSSGLRAEPWCTPTVAPNSSLCWPLTHTRLRALEYTTWMTCTAHSSTLRVYKTSIYYHHVTGHN